MLNGLSKENLTGVSVVYRDPENGFSRFVPFVEIDQYPKLLAMGGLGDAVTDGSLLREIKRDKKEQPNYSWLEVAP